MKQGYFRAIHDLRQGQHHFQQLLADPRTASKTVAWNTLLKETWQALHVQETNWALFMAASFKKCPIQQFRHTGCLQLATCLFFLMTWDMFFLQLFFWCSTTWGSSLVIGPILFVCFTLKQPKSGPRQRRWPVGGWAQLLRDAAKRRLLKSKSGFWVAKTLVYSG